MITHLLELLPKIEQIDETRIAQARDALFHADHPYLMVFVGAFSSGKSSLINALLGKEHVLRIGATPTTDRINILRYGDEPQRMDSGGEVDTVFYPSPLLRKVSFVDTPGLESIFKNHEEITSRFLHRSDVVILVMLATQAMSQRNLDYIQQLRGYGKKVIIVINQADLLDEEERKTVLEYVRDQSQDRLGFEPEIWLVSAKLGLRAQKARSGESIVVETSQPEPAQAPTPDPEVVVMDAQAPDDLETATGAIVEESENDIEATDDAAITEDDDTDATETAPGAIVAEAAPREVEVTTPVDPEKLWRESGMYLFEEYIENQLGDVDRLRQKLQTPLQIIQNVHRTALDSVKSNQAVLDKYQGISENVQQQLTAYRREEEKIVREYTEMATTKFSEAADRGEAAIRDVFQLSRAFGAVGRGLTDIVGISRLFRRGDKASYARTAFERHKVYEPLNQLPVIGDKVGPRLEGKDLQDIDDLVKYAQNEIEGLPETIRSKVIGNIQPPLKYDRTAIEEMRPQLEKIEQKARSDSTEQLDGTLRSVFFGLAVWELVLVLLVIVIGIAGELSPLIIIILLVGALLGILATPLIGRLIATNYANNMMRLQSEYVEELTKATDKQIEYGMRLRRDVISPLTRLVETQSDIQREQLNKLQAVSQEITEIESELNKLGKRGLLGIRG